MILKLESCGGIWSFEPLWGRHPNFRLRAFRCSLGGKKWSCCAVGLSWLCTMNEMEEEALRKTSLSLESLIILNRKDIPSPWDCVISLGLNPLDAVRGLSCYAWTPTCKIILDLQISVDWRGTDKERCTRSWNRIWNRIWPWRTACFLFFLLSINYLQLKMGRGLTWPHQWSTSIEFVISSLWIAAQQWLLCIYLVLIQNGIISCRARDCLLITFLCCFSCGGHLTICTQSECLIWQMRWLRLRNVVLLSLIIILCIWLRWLND